jgi:hypothetical protein
VASHGPIEGDGVAYLNCAELSTSRLISDESLSGGILGEEEWVESGRFTESSGRSDVELARRSFVSISLSAVR